MIITRAPLRIPLGGGGTDLPSYYEQFGGFFVSAAVDKYVYVSINRPASDDLIRVKYSLSEEVATPDDLKHDLVKEALKSLEVTQNVEIASMADVPAGTGMGSSGSYTVALLLGLHALKRDHQPRWQLAEEACHIEIDLAGHPVGKQDQYVAAFGGLHTYEIDRSGQVTVTPLRLHADTVEDLERCSLLCYLGQTRKSDVILGQQHTDTQNGDPAVLDSLHRTKEIGYEIAAALEAGDVPRFGELLHSHWSVKKARSSKISDPRIDELYERARSAGALGGKVMGAGGGGFLLVVAPPSAIRAVRAALAETGGRQMPFIFDLEGGKVLLNV